jgi:hypothetical protein
MQMRPALVLATATSGVLVALAYVALFKPAKREDGGGPAPPTVTGRPPAFHLDATPAQRRDILEATFPKIASDRAERLGAIKDDIALLMDDPASVAYVVAQWHVHKSEGRYAEGAFADLFALVKHKDFVGPTADLLDSPRPEIRAKAIQAAATQASPVLGPRILELYRAMRAEEGGGKSYAKQQALTAAVACRGDAFPAFLSEAMGDPDSEIAVRALVTATDLDLPGLESRAREVARVHPAPTVRLHANALLMRRGDLSATDAIIKATDPADQALATDALHVVAKYKIAAAAPAVREARGRARGEIASLFTLALLRLGDEATLNEVMEAADSASGDAREVEALHVLAASGDPNANPILLHALDRGGQGRVHAIAAGITASAEPGFLPVIKKLVEQPVGHPAELEEAPKVGGAPLLPRLAELLHGATEPAAQARFLAWLGEIGGSEARAAMLRERDRIGRLVDEQIRLVDLEGRRLGVVAPALSAR